VLVNERRGLVVAASLLAGAVLVLLLVALDATRPAVDRVDEAVRELAVAVENPPATWAATALSLIGGVWVNWPLRIAALVVLALQRRFLQLAALTLAILTSEALIGTLKAAYDRPRPPDSLIVTSGASFPSGHAIAGAVTAVGLVVVLLPPGRRRWRWEVYAVLFAFVMASSRVYLRAHWLSDVVAGGLIGGALALGWPALLQTLRGRPVPPTPEHRHEPDHAA
jgi:membrane-associated phospholipid phosphatase